MKALIDTMSLLNYVTKCLQYKGTNIEKVRKEAEQVVMDKTEFEDKLTEEIIFFSKKYQNMFENLIQGFFTILNTLNQEEMTILKETTSKFD